MQIAGAGRAGSRDAKGRHDPERRLSAIASRARSRSSVVWNATTVAENPRFAPGLSIPCARRNEWPNERIRLHWPQGIDRAGGVDGALAAMVAADAIRQMPRTAREGCRVARGDQAGSNSIESRWRGRRRLKWRRSSVASLGSFSRSTIANTAASTSPMSASAYRSHSSRTRHSPTPRGRRRRRRRLRCQRGGQPARRGEALVDPVVDLDQDRRGDHERLVRRLDERPTRRVISVRAIQRRVQGTGVQDQRHSRGSGRSSPLWRAVCDTPEAPMPRVRRFGRRADPPSRRSPLE